MRPLYLFVLLGFWMSTRLQAQAFSPEALLAQADTRFQALEHYQCTLAFSHAGHDHVDSGAVYYQGKRYHLDFPEDQTIYDGIVVMTWGKTFGSVDVTTPGANGDYALGGIYGLHRERFRFEWADTAGQDYNILLTAKAAEIPIPRVTIRIGKASGMIEAYSLLVPQMGILEYQVVDPKLNPQLDPAFFQIDWDFVKRVQNGEVPPIPHEH